MFSLTRQRRRRNLRILAALLAGIVITATAQAPPDDLRTWWTSYDAELAPLVSRALESNPDLKTAAVQRGPDRLEDVSDRVCITGNRRGCVWL